MTIATISQIRERKGSIGYAATYVESESSLPKCVPKKKRMRMIAKEMNRILNEAQDYLLRHMIDDDLSEEAKNALFKAAMEKTYTKNYYDNDEHKVVYYPTCTEMILKHDFLDEAEKFYYREQDDFPPEYRKAITSAVRAAERKRLWEEKQSLHRYEDNESEHSIDELLSPSQHVRKDAEMVEKFAESWRSQEFGL